MPHSTPKKRSKKAAGKANKFPLTARKDGRFCKLVRGRMHYFRGSADEALAEWLRVKDDLLAGRTPAPQTAPSGALSLADVCNQFLDAKRRKMDAGELSQRSWMSLRDATARLLRHFDRDKPAATLTTADWAGYRHALSGSGIGPVSIANEIRRVRGVMKWAFESQLLETPARFGPDFKGPSRKVFRLSLASKAPKLFTAEEVRALWAGAGAHLRAMIALAINCGYGNSDVGTLPLDKIALDNGWATYHRPKTGIPRRCKLWPETVTALRWSLKLRSKPKNESDAGLFFITKYGESWSKAAADNPVAKEFAKLLRKLEINRKGVGFYALRHTHRTAADAAKDQPAANAIMGHADESMAAVYRHGVDDDRIIAVTDAVRSWLLGAGELEHRPKWSEIVAFSRKQKREGKETT